MKRKLRFSGKCQEKKFTTKNGTNVCILEFDMIEYYTGILKI